MQSDEKTAQPIGKILGKFAEEKYRLLLAELQDKMEDTQTQEHLRVACMRWAYHYALNDLLPGKLPTAPGDVIRFRGLREAQKRKVMQSDAKTRGIVLSYRHRWTYVVYHNRANKAYLQEMLVYFRDCREWDKVKDVEAVVKEYDGKFDELT